MIIRFLGLICMLWLWLPVTGQSSQPRLPAMDTVYTKPTVMAAYPGGDSAWSKYVKKHLRYPRKAWWDEVETDITVRLVIDKNGKILSAQHLNMAGYGFEKEAVRLVLASGRWIPASFHGNHVVSEGQLVIPFRLR